MNYLAHAYQFLDNPLFVCGVALPDWLRVLGKQYRARKVRAESFLHPGEAGEDVPGSASQFYRGIVQHHLDDGWFHESEAFVMLNAHLAVSLRSLHGPEASIRSHFLAHIVIELLLDSFLIEQRPGLLDEYYGVVRSIDPAMVARLSEPIVGLDLSSLAQGIERFEKERFLQDYSDDSRLLFRLNQIMKRVGLDRLGDDTLAWLATCRTQVYEKGPLLLGKLEPKLAVH